MKNKTLKQFIKDLKFNYVNSDINDTNFPNITQGKITKLFKFEEAYTTQEAKDRLAKEGYRPATAWELLSWATKEWNEKDFVVAFGQELFVAFGDPFVVYLWSDAGDRGLILDRSDGGWISGTLVAGVRESSSDSLKLGSSDLDSLKLRILELENKFKKLEKIISL